MRDALTPLVPEGDASFERWSEAIEAVATRVLRRGVLRAGTLSLRPVEVEGYVSASAHPDPFAHARPEQASIGAWYFHRVGESFRGGTFKGVDLTFGGTHARAGLLIRAAVADDGRRIDGPSLLVDAVLRATGHGTVSSLARACAEGDHDALSLRLDERERGDAIFAGPRVGLTLRRALSAERVFFLPRAYRFVVDPKRATKGRPQLALGMYSQGADAPSIAGVTGTPLAQVRRWIDAYEGGREMKVAALRAALDGEALCALLGACDAAFAGRVSR